ncbi:oxidoreductase [Vibrio sp. 10N.286.49.C2]|uniref:(Fe-S)-binding protein n=1 Tax=unclassified Vibrio TaxID=2614977 RepID=UPI000C83A890|nr:MULTISPECIES: (Fe-S)-binding protein [unclassified Vibrio]PMH43337.1 oxidoreductase [Vibrio sp. 10N.286.49.C2]PMH56989.1 oxidoreductase [Vibrio sp. 10N.286.49.B1]PMH79125.1 oxidoreductase [Vibrio sp. 10N.286.48.B7]
MRIYPPKPTKVYFYATCLVDIFDPDAGLDAITLLEQQNIDVIFIEKQTCCGQPAYTSGYEKEAKRVAQSQMDLFPDNIPVIVLSGSCGGMMHHHYSRLFRGDVSEQRVNTFCERVFELTEFLVNVCRVKLTDTGQATSVVMHTSCAARREMNVHVTATQLLSQLSQVELRQQDYESECCGFGGSFSVRHPDISQAMVEDKTRHIENTQSETFVSADWGCLLNINGAFEYQNKPIKGRHLASFLLERTQERDS